MSSTVSLIFLASHVTPLGWGLQGVPVSVAVALLAGAPGCVGVYRIGSDKWKFPKIRGPNVDPQV